MKQLYQSQSVLVSDEREIEGLALFVPTWHSSCDGHVGRFVYLQMAGSRIIPGMPFLCFLCPEVAISQQIHL